MINNFKKQSGLLMLSLCTSLISTITNASHIVYTDIQQTGIQYIYTLKGVVTENGWKDSGFLYLSNVSIGDEVNAKIVFNIVNDNGSLRVEDGDDYGYYPGLFGNVYIEYGSPVINKTSLIGYSGNGPFASNNCSYCIKPDIFRLGDSLDGEWGFLAYDDTGAMFSDSDINEYSLPINFNNTSENPFKAFLRDGLYEEVLIAEFNSIDVSVVPIPPALPMMLAGLGIIGYLSRKRSIRNPGRKPGSENNCF